MFKRTIKFIDLADFLEVIQQCTPINQLIGRNLDIKRS